MPLNTRVPGQKDLLNRLGELQARLDEAEETIRALRSGEVDAIVGAGPGGDRVYTLKGADETYRIMVEEMAEGALTLTLDGVILFSNKKFAGMLRQPHERVTGCRLMDFVDPKDWGIVNGLLSGTGYRKAEVQLISDGVAFLPVYMSIQNVFLDGREFQCLIVTDLSTQKRYEELVAVLEAVPVGVFIAHDAGCTRVDGNRTGYDLLRLRAGSQLSNYVPEGTWRAVRDDRDIAVEELPMHTAARTGVAVHNYEFEAVFSDGSSRCLLGSAVPLFDPAHRTRGAVGTFIDITERKQAGEALRATNAELRKFSHVLVHGLQEPLGKVLSSSQLLVQETEGTLGAEAAEHLSRSIAGVLRMKAILTRLLHYWEITERNGVRLATVDCNRLLSQALVNLAPEIQRSGAVVTSGPLPTVVADEVMLLPVFENLIGNAVKYRGAAVPEVHVSAVSAGERWQISVRDNGAGIEKASAARIFDLFRCLDSDSVPGAGFGLALCRKVVESHGGRIWADSEAGHGTVFRFTMPIYLGPETAEAGAASGPAIP
jgi:hypothetical protein